MSIEALLWPLDRLGEGIEELARRAGLAPISGDPIAVPESVFSGTDADFNHWLDWLSGRLGLDFDEVGTEIGAIDEFLASAGPAMLRIDRPEGVRFIFLVNVRGRMTRMLAPDLKVRNCPAEVLKDALCAKQMAPLVPNIDALLERAGVEPGRRDRARAAILNQRLAGARLESLWLLRLPPSANFARQLFYERVPDRLFAMLGLFAATYFMEIVGWTLIGDAALNGRVDFGWLGAWVLLLLSVIPIRLAGGWIDATLAIDVGGLLKLRLMLGALQMNVETIRREGVGQLLGRVMESQALEALAVNGGLAALVAAMELGFAAWILHAGAGGWLHVFLLAVWLGVTFALGWRFYRKLAEWTGLRLTMTNKLIEQMVGHRTRLAQEWSENRDEAEDRLLKDYFSSSRAVDGAALPFLAGTPGGWFFVGLAGLVPSFIAGSGTPISLAIALAGVMVAHRALNGIADGLQSAARAMISWRQAGPLFHAGARVHATTPFVPRTRKVGAKLPRLIDAESITFRYPSHDAPVIDRASISIAHGDRILLEGASGGGKSTLASLIVGLKKPESGLLMLNGLDRHSLGDAWHQIATEAPQFHENHIFTATLAFNLLMGRNWPASDAEIAEAEELCRELGLGDLIDRMPSGLMQIVGETGWQLSHGERSRIFLARALLQNAQLTILDESFAALDPETLRICLECALRRAHTLVVIAHP